MEGGVTSAAYAAAYSAVDAEWQAARASGDPCRITEAKIRYRDWCRGAAAAQKAEEAEWRQMREASRAETLAEMARRRG